MFVAKIWLFSAEENGDGEFARRIAYWMVGEMGEEGAVVVVALSPTMAVVGAGDERR
jgi:hypothetical protein